MSQFNLEGGTIISRSNPKGICNDNNGNMEWEIEKLLFHGHQWPLFLFDDFGNVVVGPSS